MLSNFPRTVCRDLCKSKKSTYLATEPSILRQDLSFGLVMSISLIVLLLRLLLTLLPIQYPLFLFLWSIKSYSRLPISNPNSIKLRTSDSKNKNLCQET